MQSLKRFFTDLFAPGTDGAGDAERPLRLLLLAAILLPISLFAIASAIAYGEYQKDAQERLQRNLSTVYEHSLKVFETFDLIERYVGEMLDDMTDEQIRAGEAEYHRRLKSLTDTLPQLADIWVVDANGRPLVAGTVFPMPAINLSDRDYFRVHKESALESTYVSDVLQSRATNERGRPHFFALSRRRTGPNGAFLGVTVVSISPEYFSDYYATLPQPLVATMIRQDGYVLARYPLLVTGTDRLSTGGPFMQVLRSQQPQGLVHVRSSLDGVERDFAYRKLPTLPIYLATGIDLPDIRDAWMRGMSRHLIFGLPATFAMVTLVVVALRRTRRETTAHQQLLDEVALRESTEEKLRQSQKMEAVGRLTGGIAHDFNNLLTAIIGNLDLALRRLEGEERIRGWLSNCRQAADRAATLVQRLLSFSRQHPLEVKAVDVNRLVQGMSELLGRSIGETITIETVLAGGLWKAALDPNQLENAILNLAVNARDAMPNGGRLTIETANAHLDERYAASTAEAVRSGQYVMVAVSDTGTGISRETLAHVFEPFFTTKAVGAGSGLGLSMVYGFAKQSGGHAAIYSEVGEGTTVKLYFPRMAEQTAAVPAWQAARAPRAPEPLASGTETILVVEDDEQVNRFAVEALEERGYQVRSAGDAASALKLLAEPDFTPDLLLTDVVLPGGMNGRVLADTARQSRPTLKVLYVTGYTRNAIIHHGRLDPDIDLLTKPFAADALTAKVRRVLDGV